MGSDSKVQQKPSNSSVITSSSLQPLSRSLDDNPKKNADNNKIKNLNGENRQRLGKYGHNIANIPVSYSPAPVQPKLTIGQPNDRYEREADSVADRVVQKMNEPPSKSSGAVGQIQRQEMASEQEEEKLAQTKPKITSLQRQETTIAPGQNLLATVLQRQQAIFRSQDNNQLLSPTENKYEGFADRITSNIVGKRHKLPAESFSGARKIQRQEEMPVVENDTTAALESSIEQERGRGESLNDGVRSKFEEGFETDFADVTVHRDNKSDQLNKSIQARAFTTGKDIFFRQGAYDTTSKQGQQLLAHELTHVVQQSGDAVQAKSDVNLAPKNNKIQTKTNFAPSSGEGLAIQRKETSEEKAEPDKQPKESESVQKAEPATEEGQPPAEGSNGEGNQTPPAEGGTPSQSPTVGENQNLAAGGQDAFTSQTPTAESGGSRDEKAPTSPEQDPAFQEVVKTTEEVAEFKQEHQPGREKADEAQEAAEPPANEVDSQAEANQVEEMNEAETPEFDGAALKVKLMERIADLAPKTLEEADDFQDNNKLDSVKGELSNNVKEEQESSQGELEEKTGETPDTSGIEPKEVVPLPPNNPGTPTKDVAAYKAAPKPKGEIEVEVPLEEDSHKLDKELVNNDISEEQLEKSNQPELQAALASKQEAQTHAKDAPPVYRESEQDLLSNAEAMAVTTAQEKTLEMQDTRVQQFADVGQEQLGTKDKDEQARTKVANDINRIYENTKTNVDTILSDLDTRVVQEFDAGADKAKTAFENHVGDRMRKYKKKRYSGFWGKLRWVKDKLFGMPDEVNAFYEEGRNIFIGQMDLVIDNVVGIISAGLTEAKAEINNGKREIQNYIDQLSDDLKTFGQEAAANIEGQFDLLEQNVNDKQDELINTLARKYRDNLNAVDARIEEMKEANKGLVQKAVEFIVDAVKIIFEMTKLLMEVLSRVASVIPKILKDPIGFLGNLIAGIKQGFEKFINNIEEHLKQGLLAWLTGSLAGRVMEMPKSLDLKGIFSLVTQILGSSYEAIRAQAVKRLGEEKVAHLEQHFDMFKTLATQGVAGLWQFVKDRIGDLKTMVLEPIRNFVAKSVIKEGVEWIISLMTPASAFVKACKGIYKVIKFFIDRSEQIADLINAILDSIKPIANGNIGEAAKKVEESLVKSIPVAIGFLASILGLGDISQKVQEIIERLRKPIEKAVKWVIEQGAKAAKGVSKKFKGKFGKDKQKEEERHKLLAQQAALELKKTDETPKDYKTLRAEKETQAKKIEKSYTKKLEKGIKLTVHFEDAAKDEKDEDIDFKIVIAPNTTSYEAEISLGNKEKKTSAEEDVPDQDQKNRKSAMLAGLGRGNKLKKTPTQKDINYDEVAVKLKDQIEKANEPEYIKSVNLSAKDIKKNWDLLTEKKKIHPEKGINQAYADEIFKNICNPEKAGSFGLVDYKAEYKRGGREWSFEARKTSAIFQELAEHIVNNLNSSESTAKVRIAGSAGVMKVAHKKFIADDIDLDYYDDRSEDQGALARWEDTKKKFKDIKEYRSQKHNVEIEVNSMNEEGANREIIKADWIILERQEGYNNSKHFIKEVTRSVEVEMKNVNSAAWHSGWKKDAKRSQEKGPWLPKTQLYIDVCSRLVDLIIQAHQNKTWDSEKRKSEISKTEQEKSLMLKKDILEKNLKHSGVGTAKGMAKSKLQQDRFEIWRQVSSGKTLEQILRNVDKSPSLVFCLKEDST